MGSEEKEKGEEGNVRIGREGMRKVGNVCRQEEGKVSGIRRGGRQGGVVLPKQSFQEAG